MKKHRKLLAVIMSVALVLTLVPLALFASAETYEDYLNEDGTAKTDAGYYYIQNADELLKLAEAVNSGVDYGENSSFQLTATIDLSGKDWTPIGTKGFPFESEFDGNGKEIKGIKMTDESEKDGETVYAGGNGGLFGYVAGTIKNVHISDSEFVFGGKNVIVGAICSVLNTSGTITNCSSQNVSIKVDSVDQTGLLNYVGGITGLSNGVVEKSFSTANLYVLAPKTLANYVGGISGRSESTVKDTYFAGSIFLSDSVFSAAGGIVGFESAGSVETSYNVGLISGKSAAAVVGARTEGSTINNCYYYEGTADVPAYLSKDNVRTENADGCKSFTSGTLDQLNLINNLGQSFEASILSDYPFPQLKNNVDTIVPAENKSEFAGGNGTVYNPFKITTPEQLNNVRKYLDKCFVLENDIVFYDYEYNDKDYNATTLQESLGDGFANLLTAINASTGMENITGLADLNLSSLPDAVKTLLLDAGINLDALADGNFISGFTPIGSAGAPFTGVFDGNGKAINNIEINSTGVYAGLFINNMGKIKNLTIGADPETDSAKDYSWQATTASAVNLDSTSDSARAAAVAVLNSGVIDNVKTNVNVTVVSDKFNVAAAGITAVNNGTVKNCENTGVILASFDDASFDANYAEIADSAEIKVAGIVAVNEADAVVTGCKSSDSARSEFTSASTIDGIKEEAIIAEDKNAAASTGNSDTANSANKYLRFDVPEIWTHSPDPFTELPATTESYSEIVNGTQADMSVEYGGVLNNYQKITLTFKDTDDVEYKSVFFVWMELDVADLTADTSGADKEFLVGEKFSSDGIKVVAHKGDSANEIELSEVPTSADIGYTVEVYNDSDELISDLSSAPAGEYTVKLKYLEKEIPNSSYTIRVCDITAIEVSSNYNYYLDGQAPKLDVRATYDDTDKTVKSLKTYDYYIVDSEDAFAEATTIGGNFAKTGDDKEEAAFVGVKYIATDGETEILSNIVSVTVLPKDITVENLESKTADTEGSDVKADNIYLSWTDDYAESYTVYRLSDDGNTWTKITSLDNLTDSSSAAGKKYTYKVVMTVAGTASTDGKEIEVTAAYPVRIDVNTNLAPKYLPLNSLFKTTLRVDAVYKNDTKELLIRAADKDAAGTTGYYIETTCDMDNPGTYPVNIMYDGGKKGTYDVEVVAPTGIEVTGVKYEYYPVGYALDKFVDTLTVKASYDPAKIKTKTTLNGGYTVEDYEAQSDVEGTHDLKVTYTASYTDAPILEANKQVTFVPNVPPETVAAAAGDTGINNVNWAEVTGAVSYKVYRAVEGTDDYQLVGKNISGTTYTFNDEYAVPGAKYTYKVSAVIADQETGLSLATDEVTTVAPAFIKADASGVKKTDFVIGDPLSASGVKVYAYYLTAEDATADSADFEDIANNKNYTPRELKYSTDASYFGYGYTSTYDNATKGTYPVSITYNGNDVYNSQQIGKYDVKVYDVYKVIVSMKQTAYAVGYELTPDDYTVSVVYGEEGKDLKTKTVDVYDVVVVPNMNEPGKQTLGVMYNNDPTLTSEVTFTVFDPNAEITLTDDSNYTFVDDGGESYISKIQPETSIATLIGNLENDETTIKIVDKDLKDLDREYLATGDIVQLVIGDKIIQSKTLVVLGDTSGDTAVDLFDVMAMFDSIVQKDELEGAYLKAADVNCDTAVDVFDVMRVLDWIVGLDRSAFGS